MPLGSASAMLMIAFISSSVRFSSRFEMMLRIIATEIKPLLSLSSTWNASITSPSISVSSNKGCVSLRNWENSILTLLPVATFLITASYTSVCWSRPSTSMTVSNSSTGIVPSPLLSNNANASWNSAICPFVS